MKFTQETATPCDEQRIEQIVRGDWIQDEEECPFCGSRKTWHYTGNNHTCASGNHVCCSCGSMWESGAQPWQSGSGCAVT